MFFCLHTAIHGKFFGFSKIASTIILDIHALKLNFLLRIGLVRLQTMVGMGKSLQVSFNLDVTFVLFKMTKGLINSTAFLKNSTWQIFSGGFLDFF